MGIRRGPKITRDGLLFAIDAANKTSYDQTSADIQDLTTNTDCELKSTPMFDPDNFGTFAFDGVNDAINFNSDIRINGDFSWVIWFRATGGSYSSDFSLLAVDGSITQMVTFI